MSFNVNKHIYDVNIYDVEKRYKPSKHYVYCIWVTWSDGKKQLIFRRYSQFFDLQCKLLDTFEKESGASDPSDRILPFLPGKIIFGRSHIKSVALDRLNPINHYCKLNNDDILQSTKHDLDKKKEQNQVDESKIISNPVKSDEYICIHDYKAESKTELSLKRNSKVCVVEKNLNGWWFVDSQEGQGYVPQCVLKPLNNRFQNEALFPIIAEQGEDFIVIRDYRSKKTDELNLKKGDYVKIVEKNLSGWWTVKLNNSTGLAPAVYLEKFNASNLNNASKNSLTAWDLFGPKNINYNNSDSLPPRNEFYNETSSFQETSSNSAPQIQTLETSSFTDESIYYALDDYIDTVGDGVDLKKGQQIRVLDKESSGGWWHVKIENTMAEGWAPSAFLTKEKVKPPRPPRPKPPFFPITPVNISQSYEGSQVMNENDFKPIKVSEMKKKFEN